MSVIIFIISDPFENLDSPINKTLKYMDIFIVSLFFIEILLKNIANGFLLNGKDSYLFSLWNIIELLVFLLNLIGVIHVFYPFKKMYVQWVRSLRILHIIGHIKSLKTITQTLLQSLPQIMNLLVFAFILIYYFGLIATKNFKNMLFFCHFHEKIEIEGEHEILSQSECFDYGGDWYNEVMSFENMLYSLASLFEIATTEGWFEIMLSFFQLEILIHLCFY